MKKIAYAVMFFLMLQLIPFLATGDEIESIRNDVQSGSYDMEKINHAPIYVIRAEKYEANQKLFKNTRTKE